MMAEQKFLPGGNGAACRDPTEAPCPAAGTDGWKPKLLAASRPFGPRRRRLCHKPPQNGRAACERDLQCGGGTCCAVSLWLRGLRMCTPLGQEGDECHPFSHKVPFLGKRQHHTCPCLPNFSCSRFLDGRYRCSLDFKNFDF
uniref:Prokineticin 1 n=1 Tax=Gallus gallus TaxID=9031 RepID=A0A8V1ABC4_CHICK